MSRELLHVISELLWAALSRVFVTPLTWIVRRDRRRWLVIGREHGRYLDNAKYGFAWLHGNLPAKHAVAFLSEDRQTRTKLTVAGARTVGYPGWAGFAALLRAGTVIVDTADYSEHGRAGFLRGARIVQLWHGVPLKEIELRWYRRRLNGMRPWARRMSRLQKLITGRYAPCDVLVSTSAFFSARAFAPCLASRRIVVAGYPRNDVLLGGSDYPASITEINVDRQAASRLRGHRAGGGKVVLYAPTFRENRHSPFGDGRISLDRLASFAAAHGALIALKLHPFMAGHIRVEEQAGLVNIPADSDVYPLLRETDVLVTDYSSIFFDYLLLDRPIVFYPYDRKNYISAERNLLFDYDAMTPGPKVADIEGLMAALAEILAGRGGEWRKDRARVLRLAFDYVDAGASRRLWRILNDET